MTTDTDLRAAVASILSMSPQSSPWTPKNFPFTQELNTALAAICNAVASGDLVPRAEMQQSPDYDAGLLNDWGGGNVEWWQDYLRAEIGRANDYWRGVEENRNG